MENLGDGFGIFILLGFLVLLIKPIVLFFIFYIPTSIIYRKFLIGESARNNFFKFFFAWTVVIIIFDMLLSSYINGMYKIEIINMLSRYNLVENTSLIMFALVFWRYNKTKNTYNIIVVNELTFRKKLLNFYVLNLLIFVLGLLFSTVDFSPETVSQIMIFKTFIFIIVILVFMRLKLVKDITQ